MENIPNGSAVLAKVNLWASPPQYFTNVTLLLNVTTGNISQ